MRKHLYFEIALVLSLTVGLSACSTTGGDILGLFPAPKFLQGSINNNIYTAKDKSFTIAIPHDEGTFEYKYMYFKEQNLLHEDYVSFGPAAIDQSIYRVDLAMRATPGVMQPNFEDVAPKILVSTEQQIENAYGSQAEVVASSKTQINGRNAYYWQLRQVVPAGKLISNKPVTLVQDIYLINFRYALATVWVQSEIGAPMPLNGKWLSPEQFADSLTLLPVVNDASRRVGANGIYHFPKYPFTVTSPAVLCGIQGLTANESNTSVDFVAPDILWQIAGDYSVQVFPIPNTIKDKASFISETTKLYQGYIPHDRKTLGLNFKLTNVKEIRVGGLPALQGVGVEEGKAVFVVTAVLQKSDVTLASVIFPLRSVSVQ